jgi:hypothetical protein
MMKSMLKNGLVVGVAAALVGAAVADTKVRLRAGNNFVVEDQTTSTEAMKVYEKGGVAVTSNANPAGNLAGVQAGTLAWDSTDAELQVFDGTNWVPAGSPVAIGGSRVAIGGARSCTSVVTGTHSGGTAFNSNTNLLNCANCRCTVVVDGVVHVTAMTRSGTGNCTISINRDAASLATSFVRANNNHTSTVSGGMLVEAGQVLTVNTNDCVEATSGTNNLGVTLIAD